LTISKITNNDISLALEEVERKKVNYAKDNILAFARYVMPTFQSTEFHKNYYKILNEFIHGRIKKLIISCPPQHGKSQGSSIFTPAMMIGRDPNLKIATVCYSATKARKFGRKTKQLLSDEKYKNVFDSRIPESHHGGYINTAEEIEIVDSDGSLKMVGYQGGLTGDPVDVLLMDDLYKDWKEANSPTIRENVIDWYVTVADTRLHNNSQQLIVFTRWHEEDLVGFIEKKEKVIEISSLKDIEDAGDDCWFKINFEALKTGAPSEIDNRSVGNPLWPERHSEKKLNNSRQKDPVKFDALYQGDPKNKEGNLYGRFETYKKLPQNVRVRKNYTDTADMGDDYLCSISYDETNDKKAYVIDLIFTQKSMEFTEPLTADLLARTNTREATIESNNGGRGFSRKVNDLTPKTCIVGWEHQSKNKEARIISNAATVTETIIFPEDWASRWPVLFSYNKL
jgi:predicted phage terminase large subunit-like protein